MNTILQQPVGVTQFRLQLSSYLKKAHRKPVVLISRSKDQYVVMSADTYNAMNGKKTSGASERAKRKAWLEKLKKHGPITITPLKTFLRPLIAF